MTEQTKRRGRPAKGKSNFDLNELKEIGHVYSVLVSRDSDPDTAEWSNWVNCRTLKNAEDTAYCALMMHPDHTFARIGVIKTFARK